jgi:TfoX/Sxy family transcriptional regulator of competence genes
MFGGVGFLLHGNMACGVLNSDLIVRVGSENYEELLKLPEARTFNTTGRPMKGLVLVSGLDEEVILKEWVERGVAFALTLPPK